MRSALHFTCVLLSATGLCAEEAEFGGFRFADAQRDFADRIASFAPGDPSATDRSFLDPAVALGAPDYRNRTGAVSLGNGGVLVVAFDDNRIVRSGDDAPDLVIFEVGSDEEASLIAVSADGRSFVDVARIEQGTVGVDIDAALARAGVTEAEFRYVRITDEAGGNGARGRTAGADIDAVGVPATRRASPDSGPQDEEAPAAAEAPAVAEAPPSTFSAHHVGHYATVGEIRATYAPVFDRTPMIGLMRATATWLPDAVVVDLHFDPERQGDALRQAFLDNGYAPDRCTAVLTPTGDETLAALARSDCPTVLGLQVPRVQLLPESRSARRRDSVPGRARIAVRLELNGDSRVLGGAEFVAEVVLRPTHAPDLHNLLSRAHAAATMPPGNGLDLAGMRLDQSLDDLKAQATAVIAQPRGEWEERRPGRFLVDVEQWNLLHGGVSASDRVFPERATYEDTRDRLAASTAEALSEGRITLSDSAWIVARLEAPGVAALTSEIRMSVRPPVPEDVLVEPEEVVEIMSVDHGDGSRRPFWIRRKWSPFGDDAPLAETVTAALIEKYGEPSRRTGLAWVWSFDIDGQPVRDCAEADLAQAAGALGSAAGAEFIGCTVELTAAIQRTSSGLLHSLETTLFDARLYGADIVAPQWLELREAAAARAEAILSDPVLEERVRGEQDLQGRETKL